MNLFSARHIALAALFTTSLFACGSGGSAVFGVTVYGDEFIEQGIPASVVDDGWEISFDAFRVSIDEVKVAGKAVAVECTVDLTKPSSGAGQRLWNVDASPGEYTNGSFTITRIEVTGSATKDGDSKTFEWTFDQPVRYAACETTTTISADDAATFQITVHADRLFYDSVVSVKPQILFQPLADADRDDDGAVTAQELGATGIGAYDSGSAGDVENLWAWLNALSRTLGEVNGREHCTASLVGA